MWERLLKPEMDPTVIRKPWSDTKMQFKIWQDVRLEAYFLRPFVPEYIWMTL